MKEARRGLLKLNQESRSQEMRRGLLTSKPSLASFSVQDEEDFKTRVLGSQVGRRSSNLGIAAITRPHGAYFLEAL